MAAPPTPLAAWTAGPVVLAVLFVGIAAYIGFLTRTAASNSRLSIAEIVSEMSPQEKLGQLLIVGFEGERLGTGVRRAVAGRRVGGVILFKRNMTAAEQMTKLTADLQSLAKRTGAPGLIISADQEGGDVAHVTPATRFPSQKELAVAGDEDVTEAARTTADELRGLGININYAPVADVDRGQGRVLGSRAYSANTTTVARMTALSVRSYLDGGVMPVVKHFPGIGGAHLDPHAEMPSVDSTRDEWRRQDAPPFKEAIAAGAPIVMVSHIRYPALDPREPSITSSRIQKQVLRGELGFTGVIVTDDLEMGAATALGQGRNEFDKVGSVAVRAFLAGSDMLMIAHTDAAQEATYRALSSALDSGVIEQDRLDDSVRRILTLKRRMGLI